VRAHVEDFAKNVLSLLTIAWKIGWRYKLSSRFWSKTEEELIVRPSENHHLNPTKAGLSPIATCHCSISMGKYLRWECHKIVFTNYFFMGRSHNSCNSWWSNGCIVKMLNVLPSLLKRDGSSCD
jgi:hypothetical protein